MVKEPGLKLADGDVYCDEHGEIHKATNDPYQYNYEVSGETPECGPADWRKVWIGGPYKEPKAKGTRRQPKPVHDLPRNENNRPLPNCRCIRKKKTKGTKS